MPGTCRARPRRRCAQNLRERIGEELWATLDVEIVVMGEPVEAPVDHDLYRIMAATLRRPRPGRGPGPDHGPVRDRREVQRPELGVPTYGFSPLRLAPEERFLERFHGVDERVSLDALRFGLPVLYDVVRRYCGCSAAGRAPASASRAAP